MSRINTEAEVYIIRKRTERTAREDLDQMSRKARITFVRGKRALRFADRSVAAEDGSMVLEEDEIA